MASLTKVAFIVDLHESMGAKAPTDEEGGRKIMGQGMSPLDWAKYAIERFIKLRQKDVIYLLLTTEDGPACVRSSWGDHFARFEDQVSGWGSSDL
jgi:hypothetical protein